MNDANTVLEADSPPAPATPAPISVATSTEADQLRRQCEELLRRMPAEGLAETLDELKGLFEFYTTPVAPPKPLPPQPTPIKARITDGQIRPVYPVMEDE